MPDVSIITPLHNAEAYMTKTVASVQAQNYPNWELILVDDASSDRSVQLAEAFASEDPRIRLIRLERNAGPAVARNRGVEAAQGRYIAFLDSDDFWHPDKLEKQLAFMRAKDAALSFTAYNMVDGKSWLQIAVHDVPQVVTYEALLKTNEIGKVYFPLIRKRQDFALWLKILREHGTAYGMKEVLADYAVRPDSVSSNRFSAAGYTWKVYRDIEKLPFFTALYYFMHYALRALKKYWL
jgi:teichuronic acid biosynthesis glycosyltransferase TuaG